MSFLSPSDGLPCARLPVRTTQMSTVNCAHVQVVPCQTLHGWTGDCSDDTYLCRREGFICSPACYRPRKTGFALRFAAIGHIVRILYAVGLLKRDEMYFLPASARALIDTTGPARRTRGKLVHHLSQSAARYTSVNAFIIQLAQSQFNSILRPHITMKKVSKFVSVQWETRAL